jgi:multisubunit Na+/H+ antiporter MnhB subunit
MRRGIIAVLLLLLFLFVASRLIVQSAPETGLLMEQCLASAQSDTGARNAVAAIYLDYRVFDTILEALLLLISIIAVLHFAQKEDTKHEP